jgi:hypothetical protein
MPLNVSAGAGSWVKDFVNSDDSRFKGKSKKKRTQMALAAFYSKKRNESVSKVLRVLDDIELAEHARDRHRQFGEYISGRTAVSSDPPSGLKQPSTSGQVISGGNASITNPTSNAPMNPTVNNLNKPALGQQYSTSSDINTSTKSDTSTPTPTPTTSSTPPQSSLTTSAGNLLGTGSQAMGQIQMSSPDSSMTGGSNGTYGMNQSPRELSNMLSKNSGTQPQQQSSSSKVET